MQKSKKVKGTVEEVRKCTAIRPNRTDTKQATELVRCSDKGLATKRIVDGDFPGTERVLGQLRPNGQPETTTTKSA